MKPVMFQIWGLPVYAYSFFIIVGYIVCLLYGWWQAKKQGLDPVNAIDTSVWIFISGFIGARILYVIVSWRFFLEHPLDIIKIWNGGFVFYGGFFGAIVGALIFMRVRRLPYGIWIDLLTPVAMLCLVFGRIGCFLNGCCYGSFAPDLPWAVTYPPSHASLGLLQVPVHPAPIYESLACLLITVILIVRMPRKRFAGEIFWLMALLYSLARFTIEFFRGDPRGSVPYINLSTSQTISVVTGTTAAVFLARGWLKKRTPEPAPEAPPVPGPGDGA